MAFRIAVCIKPVPDVAGQDPRTLEALEATKKGAEPVLAPADATALVLAKELTAQQEGKMAVVSMAQQSADRVLRRCIAMGLSPVVRLWDESFVGSDAWATATVLAAYLRQLPPDLILCGDASPDSQTGLVPYFLANLLGLPCVTRVIKLNLPASAGHVRALRRLDVEDRIEVEVTLPAVIAVVDDRSEIGYPSLRGVLRARDALIPTLDRNDLKLEKSKVGTAGSRMKIGAVELHRWIPGAATASTARLPASQRLRNLISGSQKTEKRKVSIHDEPNGAATRLVSILREKRLLQKTSSA